MAKTLDAEEARELKLLKSRDAAHVVHELAERLNQAIERATRPEMQMQITVGVVRPESGRDVPKVVVKTLLDPRNL